jgi:hypothetical protein
MMAGLFLEIKKGEYYFLGFFLVKTMISLNCLTHSLVNLYFNKCWASLSIWISTAETVHMLSPLPFYWLTISTLIIVCDWLCQFYCCLLLVPVCKLMATWCLIG